MVSSARTRVLLAALAVVVPAALAVATVSHDAPHRSSVATKAEPTRLQLGDGASQALEPPTSSVVLTPDPDPDLTVETGPVERAPATPSPEDVTDLRTLPSGGAGPTTTTSSAPPAPAGPHDLLGRVVYLGTGNLTWSMRPDGTDRRIEVPCPKAGMLGAGYVALSPDGTQLLRACLVDEPGGAFMFGRHQVLVQQVDGTGRRTVYESPSGAFPVEASWAPDGRSVIVTEIAQHAGLVLVDLATLQRQRVSVPSGTVLGRPAWSPDGTSLALPGPRILDLATGDLRSLVPEADQATPSDSRLAWSPDGEWIYYVDDHQGYDAVSASYRRAVSRVRVSTGSIEELVPSTELEGGYLNTVQTPVFTPDGSVLFVDNTTLWTMGPDGSDRRIIDDDFAGWSLTAAPGTPRSA